MVPLGTCLRQPPLLLRMRWWEGERSPQGHQGRVTYPNFFPPSTARPDARKEPSSPAFPQSRGPKPRPCPRIPSPISLSLPSPTSSPSQCPSTRPMASGRSCSEYLSMIVTLSPWRPVTWAACPTFPEPLSSSPLKPLAPYSPHSPCGWKTRQSPYLPRRTSLFSGRRHHDL